MTGNARGRAACWAPLLLALAFALGIPAAPSAAADTRLQVQAGYDGFYRPGPSIPVRVRLFSDTLVQGTLEANAGYSSTRLPVEVSAGSPKEHLLFVAVASQHHEVTVVLRDENGRAIASGRGTLEMPRETELVGLLPGALAGRPPPGTSPLAVDAGTARFFVLDDTLLAAAPQSLHCLGTIGVAHDELGRLPAGVLEAFLAWTAGGGRLLVDAPPGTPVEGLPEAWHPATGDRAVAGFGEVVFTGGALAGGRFAQAIEPTDHFRVPDSSPGWSQLPGALAEAAGYRSTGIGLLIGLLAAYTLLAGPALYLLLRWRRREITMWLMVPALAVLVSLTSFGAATANRSRLPVAHGTILTYDAAGVAAITVVGLTAPRGGLTRIGFPERWRDPMPVTPGSSPMNAVALAGRAAVDIPLNPGQFGMASGSGRLDGLGDLVVEAGADGNRVRGLVRNATPYDLERVVVFVGRNPLKVGALRAGEERGFEDDVEPGQPLDSGSPGVDAWGASALGIQPGRRPTRSPVNLPLWQLLAGRSALLAPGTATVAGWTRDHRPEVTVNGDAAQSVGSTLVLARAPVTNLSDDLSPLAVRIRDVRGPSYTANEPGSHQVFDSDAPLVAQLTLPAGSEDRRLSLWAPAAPVEIWMDGAWRVLDGPEPPEGPADDPAQPRAEVAIPAPNGRVVRVAPMGPAVRFRDEAPPQVVERRLPSTGSRVIHLRFPEAFFPLWHLWVGETP